MKNNKNKIIHGKENPKYYSKALKELVDYFPELEDEKLIMTKETENNEFNPKIRKVVLGYDLVNFEIEKYGDDNVKEIYQHDNLSSGDALRYRPFTPCLKKIMMNCLSRSLNVYPSTVGSSRARQDLVDYLIREGFSKEDTEYCSGINVHNVAFASSTTQAFSMIMKVIARPHDVIIMSAPNYGIFAELSEKQGVHVETIPLREENDFLIDPQELSKLIDDINKDLTEKYKNKLPYTPKCIAYLNINPHNPIGNVMTIDHKDLLCEIGDVCLDKGVFIIDDLIYRDLTYDQEKLAFPIASIPKYFNNTISLMGLSKSFGLASFRAGFVVMPTPIFWGYATEMFELMDSVPVLQVEAVRGAFNGTDKRYKDHKNYFKKLIPKYLYQLDLVSALIYGIDKIDNPKTRNKIIKDIRNYADNEEIVKDILSGIKELKIRDKTYPQSGFFIVLDLTNLKGKYYKGEKINTEYDLLKAMFNSGKIRYLLGENFVWPYEDEFVARVNFAIDKKALIHNFYQIKLLVRKLKDEPNKKNNI